MLHDTQRDGERVEALGASLIEEAVLERVTEEDEARWAACDLASLIELRGGASVSPEDAERERDAWLPKVTTRGEHGVPDRSYSEPYWILEGGRRVGTVALGRGPSPRSVHLTSLFVRLDDRGQGIATRVLHRVTACLEDADLHQMRLETDWCAFRAVPLYLAFGMKIRMWKRDLAFVWTSGRPRWSMVVEGEVARCVVDGVEVITARRQGDRLGWKLNGALANDDDRVGDLRELEGTFAVALAARGFPLITSDHAWEQQLDWGFSDCGGPEGLAFNIQRWEAWARSRGWCVKAPRIPGLTYPTWDELEDAAEARHAAKGLR